jgi:hypothetical protein
MKQHLVTATLQYAQKISSFQAEQGTIVSRDHNRHIRDKIRQQLQVLRDTGFLTHAAQNDWRLPPAP